MKRGRSNNRSRPLYMISVAADLAGMHPQTLRIYERKELVMPQRSSGNTRLYSDADIDQLRLIQEMTAEGVNLAGVLRILELRAEVEGLRAERDALKSALVLKDHELAKIARKTASSTTRTELVMVRRGGLVRREGGDLA
ncbi:MAG: MerR family transcriptional regulator [Actinobacteria bacterium]|nr:MerR family transcriptional regulator [Actinomycetota bacterium]MCL5888046.1 MerR family transcriptional regulator [Actinomycetota bacterium]